MSRRVDDLLEAKELVRAADDTPIADDLAARLVETRSLLRGHFLLQSGLHSEVFLRAAQLLYRPADGALFAAALARQIDGSTVDVVVCSEAAASFLAAPLAERLGTRLALVRVDARRRPTNELQSGAVDVGARALVVGDVVTTGRSVDDIERVVAAKGGQVVVTAALAVLGRDWIHPPRRVALLRPTWEVVPASSCSACARDEAIWPAYELA